MKNINEHNLKMNDVQGMHVLTDQEIDEISGGSWWTKAINAVEHVMATAIGTYVAAFNPALGAAVGAFLNSLVPSDSSNSGTPKPPTPPKPAIKLSKFQEYEL